LTHGAYLIAQGVEAVTDHHHSERHSAERSKDCEKTVRKGRKTVKRQIPPVVVVIIIIIIIIIIVIIITSQLSRMYFPAIA
jgi:t-SNARE complex subunit (syntaxin)